MFLNSPYNDQTWDLIASALEGDLSPEEAVQFQQWLDSSPENRESFDRLSLVWQEMDMEDFPIFEQADDARAWEGFQSALKARRQNSIQEPKILQIRPIKWIAAAAVLLLMAGIGWWYTAVKDSNRTYETAQNEQRTISLSDGTAVTLQPNTQLRVNHRTVILITGTARFDVIHNPEKPFTVDMDAARVQDIGTTFTIQDTKDSISVSVSAGEVSFTPKATGQTRNISAGGTFCIYRGLQFNNVPLSEVLTTLEQRSGRLIRLTDPSAAQKRLTINLDGESVEDALRVICATMHLKYSFQAGEYIVY